MPPKKKKSGKKKTGQTRADIPLPEPLSDPIKKFYTDQITENDHKLSRYLTKYEALQEANDQLNKKHQQLVTDKREIVKFWKRQVDQRTSEIIFINDRIQSLQQAKEVEKEEYETQLQELRNEFQETRDHLSSTNTILGGKLAALEEFKSQKDELLTNLASLELELSESEAEHQRHIDQLLAKISCDKERLKKDMVVRVNHVAAEFRKFSNKQMADTTKSTIRENVSINSQLTKMADKSVEIVDENEKLHSRKRSLRQQIVDLENSEKDLAKKNYSTEKIICMMTDKCKEQAAHLVQMDEEAKHGQQMQEEVEQMAEELETLSNELTEYSSEIERINGEIAEMKEQCTTAHEQRRRAESALENTTDIVKSALQVNETDGDDATSMHDSNYVLERIMSLLENFVSDEDRVDSMDAPGVQLMMKRSKYAIIPGSGKGIRSRDVLKSQLEDMKTDHPIFHYQLGDLGLIPRPKKTIPTFVDKVRTVSAAARWDKDQLTKSVGCQTKASKTDMTKVSSSLDSLIDSLPDISNKPSTNVRLPFTAYGLESQHGTFSDLLNKTEGMGNFS